VTYNTTFPTELADKLTSTLPNGVVSRLFGGFIHHKASMEPGRYDALEKAGFKLDRQGNIAHNVLIRYGGHCIDVGSCKKIGEGLVSFMNAFIGIQSLC
jgi:hypothetical protein